MQVQNISCKFRTGQKGSDRFRQGKTDSDRFRPFHSGSGRFTYVRSSRFRPFYAGSASFSPLQAGSDHQGIAIFRPAWELLIPQGKSNFQIRFRTAIPRRGIAIFGKYNFRTPYIPGKCHSPSANSNFRKVLFPVGE